MHSKTIITALILSLAAGGLLADDAAGSAKPDAEEGAPGVALSLRLAEASGQLQALREAMAQLEAQRGQLAQRIADLDARWKAVEGSALPGSAAPEIAAARPIDPRITPSAERPAPLSVRLGSAEFTPGGFLDFTGIFRSTNVGSGGGTSFGAIPFKNSSQGMLSENRFSAQASRISLKITSKQGRSDLMGYVETDFLGMQPANGLVSSNGNSLRMRLYWVGVRLGKWEVLGGQSWSMLTPNRTGISPLPSDLFITYNADTNYQVGLVWSRAPQFRVLRHWNSNWTTGVSFENPQQYIGGAVTLPSSFYSMQVDNGGNVSAPSLHPDIIVKTAFDGHLGKRAVHVEGAGLLRSFRVVDPSNHRLMGAGGGGSVNLNLEVLSNLRWVANTFYSSGGGRYIFGLGPDLVIRPDGTPSGVHAASGIIGLEYQLNPRWVLSAYQGGAYFQRNFSLDAKGPVGFGYAGSSSTSNRSVEESTVGVVRTLWKRPDLGALQLIGQYSYVWRNPWSVAPNSPADAHTHMVFADLRYTLP